MLQPPQAGHIDRRMSGRTLRDADIAEDAAIREAAKAASTRREQRFITQLSLNIPNPTAFDDFRFVLTLSLSVAGKHQESPSSS